MNPGADSSPLYSPDGKYIGYRAQFRAGYESDRWRLLVLERANGKVTNLTESLDRWVSGFIWSPDSSKLFFTSEDRGRQPIEYLPVTGGGGRIAVSGDNHLDDMQLTRDSKYIVYTMQSGSQPVEIYRGAASGGPGVALTHLNDTVLNTYQLTPLEDFWVEGAEKAQVQSFLVKPPGFDPRRKYPVIMLIHGGPQGAWGQDWTYRWNAQVFAAAGYVVVMPNPRGSTGYGQKFIDDINGDWGGRAFDDIMAVADHMATVPVRRHRAHGRGRRVLRRLYGRLDPGPHAALQSHRLARRRLRPAQHVRRDRRAVVSAVGIQGRALGQPGNVRALVAQPIREGVPYAHAGGSRRAGLPRSRMTQGLQLFTALQLQKVPSKLLIYPDEGHWVLKPQNSRLWYQTVIDWIDTWTKK